MPTKRAERVALREERKAEEKSRRDRLVAGPFNKADSYSGCDIIAVCTGTEFNVGKDTLFTAIKCVKRGYEVCVHEG